MKTSCFTHSIAATFISSRNLLGNTFMTLGIVVINLVLLCIIVCCFSFCPALVSEYFLSNRLAPVYFFGFIIPFISFKQFVNGFMLFICSVFGLIVGGFGLFIYLSSSLSSAVLVIRLSPFCVLYVVQARLLFFLS